MSDMEHQRRRFPEQADTTPAPGPHQEAEYFTEQREMRNTDSDRDGLTDYEEAELGTDPRKKDTDGDRVEDGWERAMGLDPLDPDTDRDGAWDGEEILNRTDPKHRDGPRSRATLEEQSQRTSPVPAGATPPPAPPTVPAQNAINPDLLNATGLDVGAGLVGGDVFPAASTAASPPPTLPAPADPVGGSPSASPVISAPAPGQLLGPPPSPGSAPPSPTVGEPLGAAPAAAAASPAAAATARTVGGLLESRTLPPQQSRGGTTLQRQFEDGSLQTIIVDNDGKVARTTTRHNPSTGAEVVDTRMPDGRRVHREQLPGGNSIEVTTHPDGATEKTQVFLNSDGSVTTNHTDREGWSTSTRRGKDPDGTEWEEKVLPPDNRTERRTSKETRQPDGSVVREVMGPEGIGREVTSADGRRYESVFTFPDGRQETSRMVTNEDGSTLTTNVHANGRWETIRKETLPSGIVKETLTPDRGSTEITLTSTIKNADGSTTYEVDGPDSTHRTTTWPDGATENEVKYNDGTSERVASGFHPDGSKWHFTQNRDGSWERVEQPVTATSALVSRSDGTVIEQTFGDRIGISILKPDGAREKSDLDLDGGGTTTVTDATGKLVSETHHEGTPLEPFPHLDGVLDLPILSDAAFKDLDDRGVVGRVGLADADPTGDVVGDVVGDLSPEPPPSRVLEEAAAPAASSRSAAEPEIGVGRPETVRPSLPDPERVAASAPEPVAEPAWDTPAYSEPEPEPAYDRPAYASEPEPEPHRSSFDDTSALGG